LACLACSYLEVKRKVQHCWYAWSHVISLGRNRQILQKEDQTIALCASDSHQELSTQCVPVGHVAEAHRDTRQLKGLVPSLHVPSGSCLGGLEDVRAKVAAGLSSGSQIA